MSISIRLAKRFALPVFLVILIGLQGCAPQSNFPVANDASPSSPTTPNSPTSPENDFIQSAPMAAAPLWEGPRAEAGVSWTQFAATLILTEAPDLMKGTADVQNFCPSYHQLTTDEKVNFWVYLVSAVTKYESSFNPLSRMRESGMGTDPVTKLPVYSEGLLQLSYQDGKNYSFCNEFDWSKDKLLKTNDPKRTILDPIKNLRCGIRILNKIVGKHNLIAFSSGQYWSTLKPTHASERSIQAMTRAIPFCK